MSPTFDVAVASPIVGDGVTPVDLFVEVRPSEHARSVTAVAISASAGDLGEVSAVGEGRYVVKLTPPRVAVRMDIDIEVSARYSGRSLRAQQRLDVDPPVVESAFVRSSGPLDMRAPSRLMLGGGQSMRVEMRSKSLAGVRLVVNTGRVSETTPLEDGTAVATYVPPLGKVPRILLMAALDARGVLVDWLAVPLYGQAEVATASAPFASLQIQVADVLYGPVRADARGRSSLVVSVPPDVNAATTIVRDRGGNVRRSVLDLGVPPSSRMLAVCDSSAASVFVLVANSTGLPETAPAVVLSASMGVVGAPVATAPGVVTASWTLPLSTPLGELVTVQARDPDARAPPAVCETTVRSGPPSHIHVKLVPDTFVAGSEAPVIVSAELADEAGRPAVGELLADVDLGSLSPWSLVAPGRYRAEWRLPNAFGERRKAFLTARPRDAATTGGATVVLAPGQPSHLVVTSVERELVADGAMTTTLVAELRDSLGNSVESVDLEARALGHVSSFAYDQLAGTHRASYVAPANVSEAVDVVVVRSPGADLQSRTTINLEPPLAPLALGARVGYLSNFGALSSPMIAADVTWRLPVWRRRVITGIEVAYVFADAREREIDGDTTRSSVRLVPLLARLGLEIPIGARVSAYGGAASGLTIVDRSTESTRSGTTRATSAHVTLGGFVGAHVRTGPGALVFELAYRRAQVDAPDLEGNAGGLVGSVGYRF